MYILEHPDIVFSFFTIPFLGWILYKSFNTKVIRAIGIVLLILLLPVFTGYDYIIPNAYPILLYLILSCCQYFILLRNPNVFRFVVMPSIALFLLLGCISFVGAFSGTISVDREWELKDYKIEYVRDQGFSGHPLMKYELYHYAAVPIFIKHVDSKADFDTTNNCIIKFEYKGFSFDKCSIADRYY